MQADSFPRWVGDVGGTNARFALQLAPDAELTGIDTLPAADYPSLQDAMARYLAVHSPSVRPRWCAIGIANPIVGDRVQMTNHHWSFSIEAVRQQLGLERFLVINDFTALALSLPSLKPAELRQVGGGAVVEGTPIGLIGAGTGLGVSGLLRVPGSQRLVPVNGEGGHVSLGGATAREDAVIAALRQRYGHASAERALSGPGLVSLYEALCQVDRATVQPLTAAEVSERAVAGSDAHCVEALDMFFALLGSVAGNLALTLGTRGGMYIGGGIVPRLGDRIDKSTFRERFVAKGRFRDYLQAMPTFVVQASTSPALLGALRALDDL